MLANLYVHFEFIVIMFCVFVAYSNGIAKLIRNFHMLCNEKAFLIISRCIIHENFTT